MAFDRNQPHNELPLLPPHPPIETARTLKAAVSASRALAELKGSGTLIPDQAMLLHAIFLQEAKLSSEIEHVVTTNDRLYQALSKDDRRTDPATKEVLRYSQALWHGYDALRTRPLATDLFVEIASIVKQSVAGVRSGPGTRIANLRGETVYTPPQGESRIRALLRNLEEYMYTHDGVDPLIKLAVIHYQFEAIHPFVDGNGRTGRIVNVLYLVQQQLLVVPILYLSRYIIETRTTYYDLLRGVTEEGQWEDWVAYVLSGVESTAVATRERIQGVRIALDEALELVKAELPRIYSKELVELVFRQPYCRIATLERAGIAKRDAASRYLRELERIGVLSSAVEGRDRVYVNHRLMGVLTG